MVLSVARSPQRSGFCQIKPDQRDGTLECAIETCQEWWRCGGPIGLMAQKQGVTTDLE